MDEDGAVVTIEDMKFSSDPIRVSRIDNGHGKAAPWYAACDPYTGCSLSMFFTPDIAYQAYSAPRLYSALLAQYIIQYSLFEFCL